MAKKAKEEKGAFEGWSLLDTVPQPATLEDEHKTGGEELSEEELVAINAAAAEAATVGTKTAATPKAGEEEGEGIIAKTGKAPKETEEDEGAGKVAEETNSLSEWAKYMASKGHLEMDDEDIVETEEDLEKLQVKTNVKNLQKYKESLGEDASKFLDFVENGGNPADFHKYFYNDPSFEGFDISEEDNQKHVIAEGLRMEGYSDDEIKEDLALFEDTGKLEAKAKTYLNRLQKAEKEQTDLMLKAQAEHAKNIKAQKEAEWKQFEDGLMNADTIGGFKFNAKMKKDLWDYMVKPIDKKTGVTAYQKDSKEDPQAAYMFAYLLKNKWNIGSLERQVETKKVGELASKLGKFTDTRQKQRSPGSIITTAETNPFKNFAKYINGEQ